MTVASIWSRLLLSIMIKSIRDKTSLYGLLNHIVIMLCSNICYPDDGPNVMHPDIISEFNGDSNGGNEN
jgi:hypothetical protein